MRTQRRTYRDRGGSVIRSFESFRSVGAVGLAFLLILSSGMAGELHRFVFHRASPFATDARLGRFCAAHGEGVQPAEQSDQLLSKARAAMACPLCVYRSFLNDVYAVPTAVALGATLRKRSDDRGPVFDAIAFPSPFVFHSRGPPPS